MLYETELRFLCDTLQKCHIQTLITSKSQPLRQWLAELDLLIPAEKLQGIEAFISHLPNMHHGVLYRLRDQLNCHFLYCLLPDTGEEAILVIGPFLSAPPNEQDVMEWAEQQGITPQQLKGLQNYYSNIPVLLNSSYLFALVDVFGERLFPGKGFSLEDVTPEVYEPVPLPAPSAASEDALWHMRALEQRYAYENELIRAVSKGQFHKADMLLHSFSHLNFEQRSDDPLRNTKNYCIIMNTLLRKAAEQGGVHPFSLDRASSGFAFRIEQAVSKEALIPILSDMFHGYCRLVRKKSLIGCSPPVQKAITLIDADLSGSLNLRTLANSLNISSSYLSSLFKKETGQTLTDFINARRMEHARHLLSRSKLQIQTVAQHCGIMDVQYFSKLFKKATGMTPKEFRQSSKP